MTSLASARPLSNRISIRGIAVLTAAVGAYFICGTALACGWDGCFFSHPDQALKNTAQAVVEVAKTNIEQSTAIAKSMSQGDVNAAMSHVGKLVVEGECFGCKQAIQQVAGDAGVDTVEQMVTQGFITLAPTDTSMFITYDLVSNKPLVSAVSRQPSPAGISGQHPAVKSRGTKKFVSTTAAVCIVKSNKKTAQKQIIFAFSEEPILKDLATGKSASVLASDVTKGDSVSATAPLCKGENSKKNLQESVTAATMKFTYDFLPPRSGQSMKYEMIGVAVD